MDLSWAVQFAGWTVARREMAAALRAPCYRGEFAAGPAWGRPEVFGVFGDSVGCGFGTSSLERTFAARVAGRLAMDRRVLCRIHAVNGARAAMLESQSPSGDERWAAVSIGTNDALHGERPEDVELQLKKFLARLRHAERVVVLGPGDLSIMAVVPGLLRACLHRRMLTYEAALRRAAAAFPNACHFGFSDFAGRFSPGHFAADGFHPGDRGHRLIGAMVYRRLAEVRLRAEGAP